MANAKILSLNKRVSNLIQENNQLRKKLARLTSTLHSNSGEDNIPLTHRIFDAIVNAAKKSKVRSTTVIGECIAMAARSVFDGIACCKC
jgi:hypothetical protein